MRFDPTRRKPARQPEAVAAGFEGKGNPRDRATGPHRLIPPAMQQGKQPFWVRLQLAAPARQPKPVAAGFEGKCNPRDRAAGPDRLILSALQQAKQTFWVRLQLLARLTLNPGKHAGNEPARLAHLDDGYDGPGRRGTCSSRSAGASCHSIVTCSDEVAIPRRPPHSVSRSP